MPGRNEGDTTIEIPIPVRNRLKAVAASEGLSMKDWIEKKVEEAERDQQEGTS